MKLLKNTGNDRVIDVLRSDLKPDTSIDIATPGFSLFAFNELYPLLKELKHSRIVLPLKSIADCLGSDFDRGLRNRLQSRSIALQCVDWIHNNGSIRILPGQLPQTVIATSERAISGNCPITTEGLGLAPGNLFSMVQCTENTEEKAIITGWFENLWSSLPDSVEARQTFLKSLQTISDHKSPMAVYFLTLYNLFSALGQELNEDQIVKSATGIKETVVWKKLYKFQKDGVVGAIDKLERHGGCIIADSVGLGKTFEALAVIKYYELRNDRVLVLCPKRLRDNWTLYKSNDRRNFLSPDRFNYDVLNHTDLSRDGGSSGDIDLANINWGNYDLLVIDESHNFRNKSTHKERETRYDRLMSKVIQEGVKTRVLMLSATPVNNRLADLKNQISFVTEGNDVALASHGIASIETTVQQAQQQFKRWLDLPELERKSSRLIDMLGFDYFKLLDLLTIARSRKHIEKYYGTKETGKFPERLKPINLKPDVDSAGQFRSIREINSEIRHLNLSAYAPMRYVLPVKRLAYDEKYSTQVRGGKGSFKQLDREESLVHLLRVNILKRMESSVNSFTLTLQRQYDDVDALLNKLSSITDSVEELSIEDIEIDDPTFESLLIGRKVKVLLQDVDRIKWKQDLNEDKQRLEALLDAATKIGAARDSKLAALKDIIYNKVNTPLNNDNRKIIVFTAFADTAKYLYQELSEWALSELNINSALVTGSSGIQTTLTTIRKDLGSILTSFAPIAKERPVELASDGSIDLLIATDCISEGQNLQDCDFLINYDIHWNPVRIIQRFGRIDRLGSPNTKIQLVNFWPNIELEEYINLEQRVSGRMVLLDISATGEENVIEHQSGNQMNDLEYRRTQLMKLQEAVIDLEDLGTGVSITDLTLNDFRIELSGYLKENGDLIKSMPYGTFAVTTTKDHEDSVPPGVLFCLKAAGESALKSIEPDYPLAPHYLIHVAEDGAVLLSYTQTKQVLDRWKKASMGHELPDTGLCSRFDKATRNGQSMEAYQKLLSKALGSIIGKKEERSVASLFAPGGTHAMKGEFAGVNDYEVVAFLVVLPEESAKKI